MGTNQESHPSHQSLTWPGFRNRDALCRWCRDKDSNVYPSRVWGSHAWSDAGRAIPLKKKGNVENHPTERFSVKSWFIVLTSLPTELLPGVLIGHGKDYNSQHHQEVQQGCQETSALPHTLRTGLGLSPSTLDAGCIFTYIYIYRFTYLNDSKNVYRLKYMIVECKYLLTNHHPYKYLRNENSTDLCHHLFQRRHPGRLETAWGWRFW